MNMSFGIRIDKKSAGSGQEKKKKRSETEIPDRIWKEQAAHKNTKKNCGQGENFDWDIQNCIDFIGYIGQGIFLE